MKKFFALLLVAVTVFSLLPCAASADKAAADMEPSRTLLFSIKRKAAGDDKRFLDNLAKGLEERWAFSDAEQGKNLVENDEIKNHYTELFNKEWSAIGSLSDYSFSDEELKQLAEEYIQGLARQTECVEYIGIDFFKFRECLSQGNETRKIAVYNISKKFNISIDSAFEEDLQNFIDEGKKGIANRDFRNELQTIMPDEPVLEVVSRYDKEEQYRSVAGVITLKNTTNLDLSGATVTAKYFLPDETEPKIVSCEVSSFKPRETTEVKIQIFGKPENTEINITAPCEKTSMEVSTDFVPVQFSDNLHFDLKFENSRISYTKKDEDGNAIEYMYFDISGCEVEDYHWSDGMYLGWIGFTGSFLWGNEVARGASLTLPGTQTFYINEKDSKTVVLQLQLRDEAGNLVFSQEEEEREWSHKDDMLITRFFISDDDGVPSGNYTATLKIVSAD